MAIQGLESQLRVRKKRKEKRKKKDGVARRKNKKDEEKNVVRVGRRLVWWRWFRRRAVWGVEGWRGQPIRDTWLQWVRGLFLLAGRDSASLGWVGLRC